MAAARQRGVLAQKRWRARPDVEALALALDALAAEPPVTLADFAMRLQPWLDETGWLDACIAEACAAMRDDPFAAFPFRPAQGKAVHSLTLLQTAHADVSLCWIDALALPQAQERTAVFSATLSAIRIVRAGDLVIRPHQLDQMQGQPPAVRSGERRIVVDKDTLFLDNRRESLSMLYATTDAVLLRISCRLPDATPHRRFDLTTGQLVATAQANDNVSRMLPLLSIARLAGRARRAAPLLADLARHPDPHLRWSAMREWLVADTLAAAGALPAMAANDPDAMVRAAAAATLAVLTERELVACPA